MRLWDGAVMWAVARAATVVRKVGSFLGLKCLPVGRVKAYSVFRCENRVREARSEILFWMLEKYCGTCACIAHVFWCALDCALWLCPLCQWTSGLVGIEGTALFRRLASGSSPGSQSDEQPGPYQEWPMPTAPPHAARWGGYFEAIAFCGLSVIKLLPVAYLNYTLQTPRRNAEPSDFS